MITPGQVTLPPGDPRHGYTGYRGHRCRCPICMQGKRDNVAAYRNRKRAEVLAPGDPRHGRNGYSEFGCRCTICKNDQKTWKKEYLLDLAARTPAEILTKQTAMHPDSTKRCRHCQQVLPLSAFDRNRMLLNGLSQNCSPCAKARKSKNHWSHVERYRAADGNFYCVYCGEPAEHIDHYQPIALGGPDVDANMVPACAACNLSKNATKPETWLTAHGYTFRLTTAAY